MDDPIADLDDCLAVAWGEGYTAAMEKYAPGVIPIWRRDECPYRRGEGDRPADTGRPT